jgi:hypothetical protein
LIFFYVWWFHKFIVQPWKPNKTISKMQRSYTGNSSNPEPVTGMLPHNHGTSPRDAVRMSAFGEYLLNIKDYFAEPPVFDLATNSWSFRLSPGFFPESQTGEGIITYDSVTARGTIDFGYMANEFDWVPSDKFHDALWRGMEQLRAGREVP